MINLKIYISADIEGVWGIVSKEQLSNKGVDYQRARKLMTEEVNLAVDSLMKSGANEILVNDAHGSIDNILIEELYKRAKLISGN